MIKIHGVLTTRSPLHITMPSDARSMFNGRTVYGQQQGYPTTWTTRTQIPARVGGQRLTVPTIPANTFRGSLRRACVDALEASLISRGEKVSLAIYHALRCGTPYGAPDGQPPTFDEVREAVACPPIGVFGGGPRMIAGALRADTGYPILNSTIERGLVSERWREYAVEGQLTGLFWVTRRDDALRFIDRDGAEQLVAHYPESLQAWQLLVSRSDAADADAERALADAEDVDADEDAEAAAAAELAKQGGLRKRGAKPKVDGDDEKKEKFSILASITGLDVVLPGVPFQVRYDIDTDHPACVGYFLLGLERFARNQRLGGKTAGGMGRFNLRDLWMNVDGTEIALFTGSGDSYDLDRSHPRIAQLVEAAEAALESITAEALTRLLTPAEKALKAQRGKLKSASSQAAFDQIFRR